ncbi:hypothetical protein ANOM_011845 [Aspergillus nomiae NRRL 13137]|uniref:Uncharacterized protein n=1 Tax=Aspergillus nomiae NRRL (strain ATCC 15546 / NRRL 13137 / CBS 260.88 / M93) TaxID=1509407 RepID=A0A0L1IK34_ASPN3|nr:uncharacterized protein ANOM_011845 [Aspergillus nomiae NRRL 13137]KNG79872.1 hypothetical protein ANOM_011845 [Aspergillus nomiae NRRL 13137]
MPSIGGSTAQFPPCPGPPPTGPLPPLPKQAPDNKYDIKVIGVCDLRPTLSLISHIGGFQRRVIGTNPAKLWDTKEAFGGLEPDNISRLSQPDATTKHGIYLTIVDVKALLESPF